MPLRPAILVMWVTSVPRAVPAPRKTFAPRARTAPPRACPPPPAPGFAPWATIVPRAVPAPRKTFVPTDLQVLLKLTTLLIVRHYRHPPTTLTPILLGMP